MPERARDDAQLMQAVADGDLRAFGEIVRRHQAWAWRVAHRFLGDEAEAADIVQSAFLRLLDAAGRYRHEARFTGYLSRIVTRLCLDRAKKKQPLFTDTVPDIADPAPDGREALMQRETALAVRVALDRLAPNQRMAVVLRYYEDLGYDEIATALETTPKGVERLLARARQRLTTLLSDQRDFFAP